MGTIRDCVCVTFGPPYLPGGPQGEMLFQPHCEGCKP